jgi:hypothetical protein
MTVVNDPDQTDIKGARLSAARLYYYDDNDESVHDLHVEERTPIIRQLGLNGWELVSATNMPTVVTETGDVYKGHDTLFFKRPYLRGRRVTEPALNL